MRIRFQMTPGTECPVEMNFLFPDILTFLYNSVIVAVLASLIIR